MATLTVRRGFFGPAMERVRLPVTSIAVSALAHALFFAVILTATVMFGRHEPPVLEVMLTGGPPVPPAPEPKTVTQAPVRPAPPPPPPAPKEEPKAKAVPAPPPPAPPRETASRPIELPRSSEPPAPPKGIELPSAPRTAMPPRTAPAPDAPKSGPREAPSLPAPGPSASVARSTPVPELPRQTTTPGLPDSMPRSAAPPRPTSDIALPTTGDKTLAQIPPSPQRSTPVLPPTPSAAPSPSPSRVVQTPTPPAPAALPSPTPPGPTVGAPKVGTDTDVSAFAWYLAAVERKVRDNWRPLAAGPDRPIIVFEIGRNGRIQNLSVQKRSGNDAFDRGARDAIRNSDPFPPLPDVYKESILRVHLEFERI